MRRGVRRGRSGHGLGKTPGFLGSAADPRHTDSDKNFADSDIAPRAVGDVTKCSHTCTGLRDANVTKAGWSSPADFCFLGRMNGAAAIVSSLDHRRDAVCLEGLRENALPVLEALAASLGMVFRLTFVSSPGEAATGGARRGVSCAAFHRAMRERAIAGEMNVQCICPGGLLCLVKEIVMPDGQVIAVLEGAGYATGEAAMRNCELLDGTAGEWRQAPDRLEIVTQARLRSAERLIAFTASSIGTRAASGDAGSRCARMIR